MKRIKKSLAILLSIAMILLPLNEAGSIKVYAQEPDAVAVENGDVPGENNDESQVVAEPENQSEETTEVSTETTEAAVVEEVTEAAETTEVNAEGAEEPSPEANGEEDTVLQNATELKIGAEAIKVKDSRYVTDYEMPEFDNDPDGNLYSTGNTITEDGYLFYVNVPAETAVHIAAGVDKNSDSIWEYVSDFSIWSDDMTQKYQGSRSDTYSYNSVYVNTETEEKKVCVWLKATFAITDENVTIMAEVVKSDETVIQTLEEKEVNINKDMPCEVNSGKKCYYQQFNDYVYSCVEKITFTGLEPGKEYSIKSSDTLGYKDQDYIYNNTIYTFTASGDSETVVFYTYDDEYTLSIADLIENKLDKAIEVTEKDGKYTDDLSDKKHSAYVSGDAEFCNGKYNAYIYKLTEEGRYSFSYSSDDTDGESNNAGTSIIYYMYDSNGSYRKSGCFDSTTKSFDTVINPGKTEYLILYWSQDSGAPTGTLSYTREEVNSLSSCISEEKYTSIAADNENYSLSEGTEIKNFNIDVYSDKDGYLYKISAAEDKYITRLEITKSDDFTYYFYFESSESPIMVNPSVQNNKYVYKYWFCREIYIFAAKNNDSADISTVSITAYDKDYYGTFLSAAKDSAIPITLDSEGKGSYRQTLTYEEAINLPDYAVTNNMGSYYDERGILYKLTVPAKSVCALSCANTGNESGYLYVFEEDTIDEAYENILSLSAGDKYSFNNNSVSPKNYYIFYAAYGIDMDFTLNVGTYKNISASYNSASAVEEILEDASYNKDIILSDDEVANKENSNYIEAPYGSKLAGGLLYKIEGDSNYMYDIDVMQDASVTEEDDVYCEIVLYDEDGNEYPGSYVSPSAKGTRIHNLCIETGKTCYIWIVKSPYHKNANFKYNVSISKKPNSNISGIQLSWFGNMEDWSSGEPRYYAGSWIRIEAEAVPENATVGYFIWESSDESVATISNTGLVNCLKKGTTTITATESNSGVKRSIDIKVIEEDIEGIPYINDSSIVSNASELINGPNDVSDAYYVIKQEHKQEYGDDINEIVLSDEIVTKKTKGKLFKLTLKPKTITTITDDSEACVCYTFDKLDESTDRLIGNVMFAGTTLYNYSSKEAVKYVWVEIIGNSSINEVTFDISTKDIDYDGAKKYKAPEGKFNMPATDSAPINIVSWNEEVYSRLDHFYKAYPEYADLVNYVNLDISGTGSYKDTINGSTVGNQPIDMAVADIGIVNDIKYTSLKDSALMTDYSNAYDYTKDVLNGSMEALTWQATPSCFIYNSEIAESVLGSSNPEVVQSYMNDWDSFMQLGAKLKRKGIYLVPDIESCKRLKGITQEQYDEIISRGYVKGDEEWSDAWLNDFGANDVFGIFGASWYNWVIPESCFGKINMCEGPVAFNYGGSYIGIKENCANKELAELVLYVLCCNEASLKDYYKEHSEFPNNKTAVTQMIKDGVDTTESGWGWKKILKGGQNASIILNRVASRIGYDNLDSWVKKSYSGNYTIPVTCSNGNDSYTFDMKRLEADGCNLNAMSEFNNATVEGTTLTVKKMDEVVTYVYKVDGKPYNLALVPYITTASENAVVKAEEKKDTDGNNVVVSLEVTPEGELTSRVEETAVEKLEGVEEKPEETTVTLVEKKNVEGDLVKDAKVEVSNASDDSLKFALSVADKKQTEYDVNSDDTAVVSVVAAVDSSEIITNVAFSMFKYVNNDNVNVEFVKKDKDKVKYSWTFNSGEVKEKYEDETYLFDLTPKIDSFNMEAFAKEKEEEASSLGDLLGGTKDEEGDTTSWATIPETVKPTVIDFAHSGNMPGTAKVKVDVSDAGYSEGQRLYSYYFNKDKNRLELQQSGVYEGGYFNMDIEHCSEYVLTAEPITKNVVNKNGDPINYVTKVTSAMEGEDTTVSLEVGDAETLKVTVTPDKADVATVSWKSSDDKVAKVDETGKVTAVAEGKATITATAIYYDKTKDAPKCEFKVNVTAAANLVTLISITDAESKKVNTNTELTVGDRLSLNATVTPEDADDKNVRWKSSDEKVATVDETGEVTAVATGKAKITATANDGSNTSAIINLTVKAKEIPIETLEIRDAKDAKEIDLAGDTSITLIASFTPVNATNIPFAWTSDNENVAVVDENGKVTAKSIGTATITVKTSDGSKSATATIKVIDSSNVLVTDISVTADKTSIYDDETLQLSATVTPVNATNSGVVWSSSNAKVATVDETGKVTAVAAGTVIITATALDGSKVTGTKEITVIKREVKVSSITLSSASSNMTAGDTVQLGATIAPANATNKGVNWTSSNAKVASVDASGKVTAKSAGTATITATAKDGSGISKSIQITVVNKEIKVESISISPASGNIKVGESISFTATVKPSNATYGKLNWTSSNSNIAGVDATGKVTVKAKGTVTITAAAADGSGKKATVTVTVTETPKPTNPTPTNPVPTNPTPSLVEPPTVNVLYATHIQKYGWSQGYRSNGQTSGTSGESKRLEAIKIKVEGNSNLGIEYRTHIQSYGWSKWSSNDVMSGTSGEGKRLEAIAIQLTGADKDKYDVYYRVHAQSYGWLGWAKNGELSGTAGQSKRLEAIQICVLKKGQVPSEGQIGYAYVGLGKTATGTEPAGLVSYMTHVQSYGDQKYVSDGSVSGTFGEAKRLEAIRIKVNNEAAGVSGGITYTTHVQTYGWQGDVNDSSTWKKDGEMSGTAGEAKRLEAIKIKLTGEMAVKYDVYYRVHCQTFGWLGWAKNGESAGTAGYAKRLEGIQIVILPKGSAAPSTNPGVAGTPAFKQK